MRESEEMPPGVHLMEEKPQLQARECGSCPVGSGEPLKGFKQEVRVPDRLFHVEYRVTPRG